MTEKPGPGAWKPWKPGDEEEELPKGASYWLNNLPPAAPPAPPPEREPGPEPDEEWSGFSGQDAGGKPLSWDEWYRSHPFWRRLRLLAGLALLVLVGLLLLVGNPLRALEWVTGPEDPPLRVAQPAGLAQERPGGEWLPLEVGAQVPPGSHLRSTGEQTAVLRVRGGGSLRLDRDTVLKVTRLVRREDDSYQIRSLLFQGRAFVRELSIDTLPVESEFTRIQPKDAAYEIQHAVVQGVPQTQVRVYAGHVQVGLARGVLQDVTLGPRQEVRVVADRIGEIRPFEDSDDWEIWNLSWSNTEAIPEFQPEK